jgi:hypothetical protein
MKRKKAFAALRICSYKNRGRNVNTLLGCTVSAKKILLSVIVAKTVTKQKASNRRTRKLLYGLLLQSCIL